jgi:lysine biosynthesis protein LysW
MSELDSSLHDPDQSEMERCPACGKELLLEPDVVLGEVVWCDHCGVELEIVSLQPIRVDLFEEEEK